MSELAIRAIENARRERLRIAASTALPADEWLSVSAQFAVSDRAGRPPQPFKGAEREPKPAAADLDDDTKELLLLPSRLPKK